MSRAATLTPSGFLCAGLEFFDRRSRPASSPKAPSPDRARRGRVSVFISCSAVSPAETGNPARTTSVILP